MKRKDFLQRLAAASAGLFLTKTGLSKPDPVMPVLSGISPPYLQPGDTIGITCPASPMDADGLLQCQTALNRWGFKTAYGKTVSRHWQRFGGTDDERAADLQQMLDDDHIDAILFARGGYGVMRMMDKLNWDKFARKPKWLVGFSDITAFHCHVQSQYGIPTIHADMGNGFGNIEDAAAISLRKALTGAHQPYQTQPYYLNRLGDAYGKLVGGNLSLITAMQGSKSALNATGKLLLIEDVSEYKYTIDRMMLNLKRSGMLDNLAGLIVGGFTAMKKEEEEQDDINRFMMTVEEIIFEKVKEYNYPVCFNFPSGHQKLNLALKLGTSYHLQVSAARTLLSEGTPPLQMVQLPLQDSLLDRDSLMPALDSTIIK
jgi:muramoyltetrapeptide carboxypeptidase